MVVVMVAIANIFDLPIASQAGSIPSSHRCFFLNHDVVKSYLKCIMSGETFTDLR